MTRRIARNTGQTKDNGSGVVREVWETAQCTLLPASVLAPPSPLRALTVPATGTTGAPSRSVQVGADFLNSATGTRRGVAIDTGQTKDNGSGVVRPVWVACGCNTPDCCGLAYADMPTTLDVTMENIGGGSCACLGLPAVFTITKGTDASLNCGSFGGPLWSDARTECQTSGFIQPWCLSVFCFAGTFHARLAGQVGDGTYAWYPSPPVTLPVSVTCRPFSAVYEGYFFGSGPDPTGASGPCPGINIRVTVTEP
jgi:hypothetical protein